MNESEVCKTIANSFANTNIWCHTNTFIEIVKEHFYVLYYAVKTEQQFFKDGKILGTITQNIAIIILILQMGRAMIFMNGFVF